jgi:hypothetical protein
VYIYAVNSQCCVSSLHLQIENCHRLISCPFHPHPQDSVLTQAITMHFPILSSSTLLLMTLWSSVAISSPVSVEEARSLDKRATPPPPTDATFINTILTRVNGYRSQHAASPLTWDASLANTAKTAATACNGQHIVSLLPPLHDQELSD